MERKMASGLGGMKMVSYLKKNITKMGKKMVFGNSIMRMVKRKKKEITKMAN